MDTVSMAGPGGRQRRDQVAVELLGCLAAPFYPAPPAPPSASGLTQALSSSSQDTPPS